MGWGFNEIVREKIKVLGANGRSVSNSELAVALDLVSDKGKRDMYRALIDMRKRGEIIRVKPGLHAWIGKSTADNELRRKIWRVIRARRTVAISDLVELTGASVTYVKDYIQMLSRREIIKPLKAKGNWKYQLINDPVIMPEDTDNANKARKYRQQKKAEALAALDAADLAIKKAKEIISTDDQQ